MAGAARFQDRNLGAAIRKMRNIARDHDPAPADLKV